MRLTLDVEDVLARAEKNLGSIDTDLQHTRRIVAKVTAKKPAAKRGAVKPVAKKASRGHTVTKQNSASGAVSKSAAASKENKASSKGGRKRPFRKVPA